MRRKDREITDFYEMLKVVEQCDCCRLGFQEAGGAYILPMNFGYEAVKDHLVLYFHGSTEGKKMDLIRQQARIGFEMDTKHELVVGDTACRFSFLYQSVIGKGKITLLEDAGEKEKALALIMNKYSGQAGWEFLEQVLRQTAVMKLEVTQWSCKEH